MHKGKDFDKGVNLSLKIHHRLLEILYFLKNVQLFPEFSTKEFHYYDGNEINNNGNKDSSTIVSRNNPQLKGIRNKTIKKGLTQERSDCQNDMLQL